MRHLRKVGLLCLTVCMLACFAIGAIFAMSYAQPVKSGYGNAQLYKNNDIKFEDRLFDVAYYKENRSNWQITSGPYTNDYPNNSWSVDPNATIDAYLIDGTYYYGDTTGGVNTLTKVFVYVGFPDATKFPCPDEGYPAMVLVHGGGGTAYSEWVAEWTARGYVAIAMDTEGKIPVSTANYKIGQIDGQSKDASTVYYEFVASGEDVNTEQYKILTSAVGTGESASWIGSGKYKFAKQNAWFSDTIYGTDYKTHWFYQATAAVIASNTFLRTFDNVNQEKIGITGISYGSYLTCLAVGYDGRFECAVPIYGSLNQQIGDKYFAQYIMPTDGRNSVAAGLWDNPVILKGVKTPTLFLMGNTDYYFDVRSTWSCAKLMKDAKVIIRDNYPHSHTYGALYSNSSVAVYTNDALNFIDSILKNETSKKLSSIVDNTYFDDSNYVFNVSVPNGGSISQSKMFYTTKELLINDGEYLYNGKAPSYGDYTYGDIINNGKYTYYDQSDAGKNANCFVTWSSLTPGVVQNSDGSYRLYIPKNDTNYFPEGITFFYFEILDSNGRYLTSQVMDVGAEERPLYTNRLYSYRQLRYDTGIREFDWSADENGFAISSREENWVDSYGLLKLTPTYDENGAIVGSTTGYATILGFDTSETTTNAYGATTTLSRSNYGARSQSYSKGVTSIHTDAAGVMNYRAFNVYEDIEFYYNISSANSYYMAYHKTDSRLNQIIDYTTKTGRDRFDEIRNGNDSDYILFVDKYNAVHKTDSTLNETIDCTTNAGKERYKALLNSGNYNITEAEGSKVLSDGAHCYFFSLFDNIETAFKNPTPWGSNTNNPLIMLAGANDDYDSQVGTYRAPLNGKLSVKMNHLISGSTPDTRYSDLAYDETAFGDGKGDKKDQLWFGTAERFFNKTSNDQLDYTNYDNTWYKVTIRILDEGSYVYVNGNPIVDPLTGQAYMLPATRGDFKNGFAYLQYSNSGSMRVNIKFGEEKYFDSYGKEFEMLQDVNGFSIHKLNADTAFYTSGVVTSDPEIGPEFGSVDSYASGGVSSFVFNDEVETGTGTDKNKATYAETDGSVIRYVPFDVTKDIHFAYNFTPELKFANVNTNTFHYYIALYDSLNDAFASGDRGWDSKYNYTTEYGEGVDYNPVIALTGSNMTGNSKDGYSRAHLNGALSLYENYSNLSYFWTKEEKYTDERLSWCLYPSYPRENAVDENNLVQGLTEENWYKHYIDVRIRIGESETTIYLNGTKFCTTKEYTRSDFPTGNAYFKFYAFVNSGEVKVNIKVNDELQDIYKNNGYRDVSSLYKAPLDLTLYNKASEKFEFPMNEYGWNSMSYHGNGKYDGPFDSDTDQYFLSDGTTSIVGAIDRSDTIVTKANGITSVTFSNVTDGKSIINYLAYDINQDISFSFRVNDGDATDSVGKSCFFFSLFDTLTKAFASQGNAWDVSGVNSGENAPILAFESTNGNLSGRSYNKKLKVNLYTYEFITVNGWVDVNTHVVNGAVSSIKDDKSISHVYSNAYTLGIDGGVDFNTVTIRVLDDYTLLYFNGELVGYYIGLGKAKFPGGKVYLKLTSLTEVGSTVFDLITHGKSDINEKFDYSQDLASNFGNSIVSSSVTKTYENAMGETIIASRYGVAEGTTFGLNSATLKLDNSFTVNYKGFDVTKDILFAYDVNVPSSVANDGKSFDVDSFWYSFAFFNDIEMATKYGLDLRLVQQSNFASGGHAKISLFGCNDPWGKVPRMNKGTQEANYSSSYSTLTYNSYKESTAKQTKFGSSEYSKQISHLVKLRILEDCTEFYVDNELMFTDSTVTRADFPWGYAYMSVGTVGQGTFNIEIDRLVELYDYYTGNTPYDYATDANGWTTEKSTDYDVRSEAYSYVSADTNALILNSNFSRGGADNGALTNDLGYSILNLGVPYLLENSTEENTEHLGISTFAINTVGFDVNKPIRLVYRFESFASAGGKTSDASCLVLSFAESIADALKINNGGYGYTKADGTTDVVNAVAVGDRLNKLMFKTCNTLWETKNNWTDEFRTDNRFAGRITAFEGMNYTDGTYFSDFLYDCSVEEYVAKTGDDSTWQKYITLDVNIGEKGTVVTIDGKVVDLGPQVSTVKRSDFKLGKAYLNVSAHGGVEVAIGVTQSVEYAEGYNYGEKTSLLLENGLDFINEFELPVGYYNPRLQFNIIATHNDSKIKIDNGIIEFNSGFISPHHASKNIIVSYFATIGGTEKLLHTKTFVLKDYLESLYASCGEGETAKKNLIVSIMNLCAAGQQVEPSTRLDTTDPVSMAKACNAKLKDSEKAFATEYDTLKATGAFDPVNGAYKHYAFEKRRDNQTTNFLGFTYLGVGIGSTSTYTIRFIVRNTTDLSDNPFDASKLAINVGFRYTGDNAQGVNTFKYSEVATIENGGIKLYSTSTYSGYTEYMVTCYGEYYIDAKGNTVYTGIKASDFWQCVQFACYYDGTLYGVSQGSILGYANYIASQANAPAESVAFGKAIQMYYVKLIEYNKSLTNV